MSEIAYVTLKGGEPAGKPNAIDFKDGTPDTQADHALARLKELAAKFENEATPYLSLVHPMWTAALRRLRPPRARQGMVATGGGDEGESNDRRPHHPRRRAPTCRSTAADPDVSAFVSANAGSGKTYVLAQRVINLLLRGVDPAKILCITFTKTAAANMANEVFKRLAAWTALDDAALDKEIALSTGAKPSAEQRARARRLFASALETPGGLKVQTIHAFCTRLLHQFPFEANVAARFTVLDEATDHAIARPAHACRCCWKPRPSRTARSAGRWRPPSWSPPTRPSRTWSATPSASATRSRPGSSAPAASTRRSAQLSQTLRRRSRRDTAESIEQEFFAHSLIPAAEWPALIEILDSGSKSDKQSHRRARSRAQRRPAASASTIISTVFCTAELEPRKNIVTKKIAEQHPDWLARLLDEQDRVCALLARERALAARDRTARARHHRGRGDRALPAPKRTAARCSITTT